jgi:hypothetical protein
MGVWKTLTRATPSIDMIHLNFLNLWCHAEYCHAHTFKGIHKCHNCINKCVQIIVFLFFIRDVILLRIGDEGEV